jgi:glycosyltransferase involved in cell wall biosynthesis
MNKKPRIAFFSPISPIASGISHYTEELLPFLSRSFDIDIYIDDYKPDNRSILDNFKVFNYLRFDSNLAIRDYQQIIYHLGNNIYHNYIYPFIYRYSGILVLHDYVLHHSRARMLLSKRSPEQYRKEMIHSYKDSGSFIADFVINERYNREVFIDHLPLNEMVVEKSDGIIVHNNFVKEMLSTKFNDKDIEVIRMGISIPERLKDPALEKEKLGFRKDELLFTSLGRISSNKKYDLVFKALNQIALQIPDFKYILIGPAPEPHVLTGLIPEKISDKVIFTGHLAEDKLESYLNASDLIINLREPYTRETSASMLRGMSYGKPLIISHLSNNLEIPNEICYKVAFSPNEIDEISQKIIEFCKNPDAGRIKGRNARKYIFEKHSLERSAAHYKEFILSHLKKTTINRKKCFLSEKNIEKIIESPLMMLKCEESDTSESYDYTKKAREYLSHLICELGIINEQPTDKSDILI